MRAPVLGVEGWETQSRYRLQFWVILVEFEGQVKIVSKQRLGFQSTKKGGRKDILINESWRGFQSPYFAK